MKVKGANLSFRLFFGDVFTNIIIVLIKETIARRIFYFRSKNDLSLTQLGARLEEVTGKKYDKNALWSYENEKRRVPAEIIPAFAEIFNITTDELFYTEDELTKRKNVDTLGAQVAEYRDLANNDPKQASEQALKIIEDARREIQQLKNEVKTYQKEAEGYKSELERVKPVIQKIEKYIQNLGYSKESETNK